MDQIEPIISSMAHSAKKASYKLAMLSSDEKRRALRAIADSIDENRPLIKAENRLDIKDANDSDMSDAMIDRLPLTANLHIIL